MNKASNLIDADQAILQLDVIEAATELADNHGHDTALRARCTKEAQALRVAQMALYKAGHGTLGWDVANKVLEARGLNRYYYAPRSGSAGWHV
jgi:hypothetical protein